MHSLLLGWNYFLLLVGIFAHTLSKNTQMWYIGIMSHQCFERSEPNHWLVRHSILYVRSTIYFFISQIWRNVSCFKKACSHLFQISFFSLSYTMLLWCVWEWVLHMNAHWGTHLLEFSFDIISSIIQSECFDILPGSVLNWGFENFKGFKHLRLMLQKVDPIIYWTIINEGQKVSRSIHRCCRH